MKPGVGYTPRSPISRYKLDDIRNPYQAYTMDLTADPWSTGKATGDQEFDALYERRYGPYTLFKVEPSAPGETHWFKVWAGPSNEVRFLINLALVWEFKRSGDAATYDGVPTEREITDVQATGDAQVWQPYLIATAPGYTPETRVTVDDPDHPSGDSSYKDPFWGMTYYIHNTHAAPAPPPPPVDPVPPPAPVDPIPPPALPPVDHHVALDAVDLHTISVMGDWPMFPYIHKMALLKRLAHNLSKATAIVEP